MSPAATDLDLRGSCRAVTDLSLFREESDGSVWR